MNTIQPHFCNIKKDTIYFLKHRNPFSLNDIIMLQGDSNYTFVHLQNGRKLLVSRTLKWFEMLLEKHGFLRTHRGFIINCNHLLQLGKTHQKAFLTNNLQASISRRRRAEVSRRLNRD